MKLMSIDIGMYGGHATHLKLYVQKDNEENYPLHYDCSDWVNKHSGQSRFDT